MKTPTEILAMSELDLYRDHARLDMRLDIRECEANAYQSELFILIEECIAEKRFVEAQRIIVVMDRVRTKVGAFLDQLETSK